MNILEIYRLLPTYIEYEGAFFVKTIINDNDYEHGNSVSLVYDVDYIRDDSPHKNLYETDGVINFKFFENSRLSRCIFKVSRIVTDIDLVKSALNISYQVKQLAEEGKIVVSLEDRDNLDLLYMIDQMALIKMLSYASSTPMPLDYPIGPHKFEKDMIVKVVAPAGTVVDKHGLNVLYGIIARLVNGDKRAKFYGKGVNDNGYLLKGTINTEEIKDYKAVNLITDMARNIDPCSEDLVYCDELNIRHLKSNDI